MNTKAIYRGAAAEAAEARRNDVEPIAAWGQVVRDFRRLHAIKQTALAEMLGVDQATISRWERGQQTPESRARLELRALVHDLQASESRLKSMVKNAATQSLLAKRDGIILVGSASYCAAHRVPQDEIVGRSHAPMFNEEAVRLNNIVNERGFFDGDLASVTLVARCNTLSRHRLNVPVRVVWTPVRIGDGEIVRRTVRTELADDDYEDAIARNGGPFRIVTIDDLAA